MAICDAATTGNLLYYGDVPDQAVASGDAPSFPTGDLDITQS